MKEIFKSILFIIGITLLQIIFIFLISLIFYNGDNYFNSKQFETVSIYASFIYTIIMIILLSKKIKFSKLKLDKKIISIIIGIIISLIFNLINKTKTDYSFIVMIESGIVGPILEEIMYRGIIYEKINIKHKEIIITIIFALFHKGFQIIYAFILGLILIYFRKKYDSIKSPILIHVSANLTSLMI